MVSPSYAILAYALVVLASRQAFQHRECVRAGVDGSRGAGSRQGALLCLLPLGLMQLGPLAEYWLRLRAWERPPPGFFGLLDPRASAAGLAVFALGTLLAAAAARGLGRCWRRDPGQLCTGGLYGMIRHPMYAGYLLQGAGCNLMLGARWSWALMALGAALILVRIFREDHELAALWPEDFAAYRQYVRRLVPGVF